MAEEDEKIKKVTMTSTKKEMLDAYNALVKQLRKKEENELSPEEMKEEKRKKEIMKDVDSLSSEGVVKSINALKAEIGNLLATISNKLEEEVSKYIKIKEGIWLKEKELQEIYEIEKNASTLTALLEAQVQKRTEFENEMRERKDAFEHEMKELRAQREEEKKLHEAQIKEQESSEQKKRQRDREEFEYSFKRQQQTEKDKFEDEKAKLKKQMQVDRETFEKELSEREAKIAEREEELLNLRNKAASFPKEMESAVNKSVKETTEKLNAERKNAEEFQKKIFEGERNVLNTKMESLEKRVKEQSEEIIRLSHHLDEAYQKIQNIAVKSIFDKGGQSSAEKSD